MHQRTYITDFKQILPRHHGPQQEALDWLAAAHARAEATAKGNPELEEQALPLMKKLVNRYGCTPESIGQRYSELDDFLHRDWDQMKIFNLGIRSEGQGLEVRNAFFAEQADRALNAFFAPGEEPPAELLHVTCTGYASPSAIQRLVDSRGWHDRARTTQVYHMGCYAALPAMRVARGLLLNPQSDGPARAEIVHTELCTLHFNPVDHRPEQLVVQGLFADGHIRYSLRLEGEGGWPSGFELLGIREEIVPDTLEDMTWVPADNGFRMTLTRAVPDRIAETLPGFLERIFLRCGLNYLDERPRTVFAIHPGGPRIIDSIQTLLDLRPDQVETSRAVLFERGNMSSATLPHIWARLLDSPDIKTATLVASLAFGPGLTIAGGLFRKL